MTCDPVVLWSVFAPANGGCIIRTPSQWVPVLAFRSQRMGRISSLCFAVLLCLQSSPRAGGKRSAAVGKGFRGETCSCNLYIL